MTLKERIEADFMTAFKAKETDKKNFLGVIKGEMQNLQGRGIETTDETVMTILKKMEKSLNETGTDSAKAELVFLKPYLPTMMDELQVRNIVKILVESGKNDLGSIMKEFSTNYKGLADNKLVSQVAREFLS